MLLARRPASRRRRAALTAAAAWRRGGRATRGGGAGGAEASAAFFATSALTTRTPLLSHGSAHAERIDARRRAARRCQPAPPTVPRCGCAGSRSTAWRGAPCGPRHRPPVRLQLDCMLLRAPQSASARGVPQPLRVTLTRLAWPRPVVRSCAALRSELLLNSSSALVLASLLNFRRVASGRGARFLGLTHLAAARGRPALAFRSSRARARWASARARPTASARRRRRTTPGTTCRPGLTTPRSPSAAATR